MNQFYQPEVSGTILGFQMTPTGASGSSNVAVYYDGGAGMGIKAGDCVEVKGTIEGSLQGQNAFGANVQATKLQASYVQKMDCMDVLYPAKKTVIVNTTQSMGGADITLEKVEFADDHTRVYMKVKNKLNDKLYFYSTDDVAFQGTSQYKIKYIYGVTYPEIDSEIYPGVVEEGIVIFDPLDYMQSNAKFQFEVTTSNYYSYKVNFNVTL